MAVQIDKPIVCPVLIGRDALVAAIHQVIDAARTGTGQGFLIAGEAGVGKSRLAAEAGAYGLAHGMVLHQSTCFPQDRACPYAPLLDLVRARFADQPPAAVAAAVGLFARELFPLLPELVPYPADQPPLPALDAEQEKRRLFAALAHCLRAATLGQPLLLLVEDLHWSDESSLDFLLYVLRHATAQPLLLIGTYRSDELTPALRSWLVQIDRERRAQELALPRLTRDDVAAMLRVIFAQRRPVRAEFLDTIFRLTDGNPFYVEEVLKSLVAAGDVFYVDGSWIRKPLDQLRVPRSLHDAVQQRVHQLSAEAREVLALAAVVGRRFDFALLQQLSRRDDTSLLRLLKELIAAQLVVEESAERFAFRHALTREVIYADLLARERRVLHRTIAESIEHLYAPSLDTRATDLAYHFSAAEVWERARTYAQRAGERAQALGAPYAAVEQFTRALEATRQLAVTPDPTVVLGRGRAYAVIGDFAHARADYEQALDLARAAHDGVAEWQSLVELGLLWAGRDYARAGAWFQRALEHAQTLDAPILQAHSLNRFGNWLLNTGQVEDSLHAHHEALQFFQSQQDTAGVAETLDWLGMANGIYGDELRSVDWYNQAIERFRALGDQQRLSSSLAGRCVDGGPGFCEPVYSACFTRAECARDGAEALQLAQQLGWAAGQAFAAWTMGQALAGFGDFGAGLAHAEHALQIATEIEHQQWTAAAHSTLGQIYVLMCAPDQAIAQLETGLPLARALGSPWWIGNITTYLALAYLLKHDSVRAEAALAGALRPGQAPRSLSDRRMLWAAGELALAQDDPQRAIQIADQLIASAPGAPRDQPIPALLLLKGAALLALHHDKDALQLLEEARRGVEERGAHPGAWQVQRAIGRTYQRFGQRKQAQTAFAAAREIVAALATSIDRPDLRTQFQTAALATLPQVRTATPLRAAATRFGGLTAREREVAVLIVQGKSNQDIASILFLGKRTIETHIANIMAKLDTTSRAQIALWAKEEGLV